LDVAINRTLKQNTRKKYTTRQIRFPPKKISVASLYRTIVRVDSLKIIEPDQIIRVFQITGIYGDLEEIADENKLNLRLQQLTDEYLPKIL